MINCAFLIFHHCTHCIKEFIPLSSGWFRSLNSIHALKTKWAFVLIYRNIGVRSLKTIYIICWWIDIDPLIHGKCFILKFIAGIQNTGSDSMRSCYSNVDSEGVSMCHWTVLLIKINTLNMRTPNFTVA